MNRSTTRQDSKGSEPVKGKEKFENGATRSVMFSRHDLVPIEADELLAARFGLGAARHSENGWKKGGVKFIQATFNHIREHEIRLRDKAQDDDNLAAILCNYAMLAWFRRNKPAEFNKAIEGMR